MVDVMLLDSEERIKAFTHPYRMKLVHVLRETRRPMTATEVARFIGDGPGRVHYHMRVLEAVGIVTVARTETVNGIVARYYEPTARHYSVGDAVRGTIGGEAVRDEVTRMIGRRFRDGLRSFLDSAAAADSDADAAPAAFLFERSVHCDDGQWLEFRDAVEALAERYAEPGAGSRRRRVFVAGTTDRRDGDPGPRPEGKRAASTIVAPDWPPHPGPDR
ncbi:MAG TPA: helix-turn-helix domain-containing protein [Spirochaetia bacterium]|nr:helix-turn-helix transcriptional regulator [Spirochaetaceae bacterium]HPE90316.1 helix-turn-helix domain-containing protein [Spirochaetales bacterium]HRW23144.1 helix-turn-helix domain-containing protein [Spirochaetia bacterium]